MISSLDVISTHSKGRCVKALSFIRKGSVLLCEKPSVYICTDPSLFTQDKCRNRLGPPSSKECLYAKNTPTRKLGTILTLRLIFLINSGEISSLDAPAPAPNTDTKEIAKCAYLYFEGSVSMDTCIVAADKVLRNAFTVTDSEIMPKGLALYDEASYFNHSCEPNACPSFDPSTGIIIIRACQDIYPGQEVSVAYIDVGQPTYHRRLELLNTHRFICYCSRCTMIDNLDHWVCKNDKCGGLCDLSPEYHSLLYRHWLLSSPSTLCIRNGKLRQVDHFHTCNFCENLSPDTSFLPFPSTNSLEWLYSLAACPSPTTGHCPNSMAILKTLDEAGVCLICDKCGSGLSLRNVYNLVRSAYRSRNRSALVPGENVVQIAPLRDLMTVLQTRVPPNHYIIFDLGSRLCVSLINAQRYEEAFDASGRVLCSLSNCYPLNHPVVAIQYIQYSKLYIFVRGKDKKMYYYCELAMNIVDIVYGSDHPLHQEVSSFLRH